MYLEVDVGAFSDRMQALSERLLSFYGQSITFTRDVLSTYNPSTGESTVSSTNTYSGNGNPSKYSLLELASTNVLETDIKLLFYSSTKPAINDSVTINSVAYRVQNVDTSIAQGEDCLYTLQLRIG